jgi:hypothetical protein
MRKGSTMSLKSKAKMSVAKIGSIPWNKGKTGLQVSSRKGIPLSEETKKKLSESLKGREVWNKDKTLPYMPHFGHRGKLTNEKNPLWKGDKVSFGGLHMWVRRKLGKPAECVYCGKVKDEGMIEWASVSHQAKRDLNDFIPLCVLCHRQYDFNYRKNTITD